MREDRAGRRSLRILRRLLTAAAVVLLLTAAAVAGLLWRTFPTSSQTATVPGLTSPVTITMDHDGIPRIRAESEGDAAAALGFLHARDRMFQLELLRRAASGRLSELVGARTVPFDREMRILGLRHRAEADYEALPAGDKLLLQRYASGVNAWVAGRGRFSAPEFIVLGPPEAWTPVDSLLWAKTMGLWLAGNWQQELARLTLSKTLPVDRVAQLWPDLTGRPPEPGAEADPRVADSAGRVLDGLPQFPEPFTLPSDESNGWAVDGALSATGSPLLAGDPHLVYSLPGLWYLARIERPDGVWAGATAPGVPGIVMGRNGAIAWTFTTTGADTQDVFVETLVGDEMYATPDGPKPFLTRDERILVRGEPDVVLHVRETRHGPVISDIAPEPGGPLLAVAMASLAPGETAASGFIALNRARDVTEAVAAGAMITSPVQNMFVADRAHIALLTTGRVPIRNSGDGRTPVPGADGAHDWQGFAAGNRLPLEIDPASHFLANGNEPVAAPNFPIPMGWDAQGPWRGQRIKALLAVPGLRSIADFTRMQSDVGSDYARQFLPALRRVVVPDGPARKALALLGGWDGTMTIDSPAPLIFNAWLTRFRENVLRKAGVPVRSPAVSQLGFVAWLLSADVDQPARAAWCGGLCDHMLADALVEATADLSARLGDDPAAWRWGDVHMAVFDHPVLRFVPLLGRLVGERVAVAGDTTTINRQEALFGQFESVHGGAYRAAYDLADLDRSRFMTVPGQSGQLLAATARTFVARWAAGETITLGPEAAGAAVTAQIKLVPEAAPR